MSEIIKKSDVSEADIYGYVIDSAKKAEIEVSKLNAELRESAKLNTAVLAKNSKLSNASEIKATENAIKLANFQMKESIKLDNEKIKLEAQRINAETKLASAIDKSTRSVKDNSNAYKQMSNSARDLKNESKRLGAELDHLVMSGKKNTTEYSKLSKQYKDTTAQAIILDSKLKKLDSNVGDNQRSVGNYSKAIGGLKNGLMQLGLGFGVFQGIKFLAGTEIKLQSLQLALKNVMGTTEEYTKAFSFLSELSLNYGQDLTVLTGSYKNFIASSNASGLALEERNKIYQSIIKSGSGLALSNEQIEGSLLAVSQMFSKGKVSAEELRGQLGERLPGAFGIMAKSMNVSEQELGNMMQRGEVLAKDVLPKFAIELEKTFGKNAEKNLTTIGGAWNVLQTKISLFVNSANEGGRITKVLASGISFLANNLSTIVTVLGYAAKAFIGFKIAMVSIKLSDQYTNWKNLKNVVSETGTSTTEAGKSAKGFGNALKGIGFAIAIELAFELTKGFYEMATGVDMARTAQDNWNKSVKQGQKFGADVVNKLQKEIELNKISVDEARKRVKFEIQTSNENKRLAKERIEQIQAELSATSQWTSPLRYRRLTERLNAQKNILAEENTIIKEMISFSDDLNIKTNQNTSATDKNTKSIKKNTEAKKENFQIDENKLYADNLAELQKLTDEELALKKAKDDEEKEMIEILSSWRIKMWEKEAQDSKDNDERIAREKAEKEAEMFKTMQDFAKLSVDYFIKKSEEKIAQIDKEIEASEKQSSILEELAKNGNITAQQSLAEQQQITNKANMEKIKEQKRIERLKLAETAFNVYGSKVEAGDKNPLVNTIKDVTLLTAFIASLPAFEKGTENTGKNGQGVDGKGGFHAILHPNERVMTSEQNDLMGNVSNNDVAKIVESYKMGKMVNIRPKDNAGNTFDLMPLLAEIKGLKQAINDKPTTNIELGKITQSTMQIIETTSKLNRVDRKIFNIRK